ncbi:MULTISPECIES: hypothetical protein [Streptomyces]|uniref:hypothetical protein n=1 Tax=Streptomyces TaxID=1883 RepID=UPI000BEF341A|nr:hypothetical protein [Streptomyces sp. ms184]
MFHGGKTPLVPRDRLRELDYRLIIVPSDLQRAAITAVRRTLEAINRDGDSGAVREGLASFAERERIVRTAEYLAIGPEAEEGRTGAPSSRMAGRSHRA